MLDGIPPSVPSTPDATWTALTFTLLRSLFLLASAVGFYHGTVNDSVLQIIAGAVVAVGTALWGVYDKIQAARKDHEGSVVSAQTKVPQRVL